MSNMYEQFETDENLETAGIWLDYGDFRVRIARSGGANKKYSSLLEAKSKPYRRAIQTGIISEDRIRAILYEVFASAVILDWQIADGKESDGSTKWVQGISKKGGGTLPFSTENVLLTFKNLPALFTDIQSQAESITLFRAEELEADAKN